MKLIVVNARTSNPFRVMVRLIAWLMLSTCMLGAMTGGAAYVFLSRDLPEIPPFDAIRLGTVSTVSDQHGLLLGEVFKERRYLTPMEGFPDILVKAVLSSEDERFFEHSGTDLRGILRAVVTNLRAGKVREGASTITQQVARSLLLSGERSFKRKAREGIIARRLEDIYTKDQILALYLNLIYLGEGCYGVEAASRIYFGKTAMDLTVPEAATIAALPQSPSSVTPMRNQEELVRRRDRVINRMLENGSITAEQAAAALASRIVAVPQRDNLRDRTPFMTMEVITGIKQWTSRSSRSGILVGGGNVHAETTIDTGLQLKADRAAFKAAMALSMRQGWAGALATIKEQDVKTFLDLNGAWISEHPEYAADGEENPLLAVVTAVDRKGADVALSPVSRGRIPIELMKWAIPYTRFDERNITEKRGSLSLDGRLKDATDALKIGDVVLVLREHGDGRGTGTGVGANDNSPTGTGIGTGSGTGVGANDNSPTGTGIGTGSGTGVGANDNSPTGTGTVDRFRLVQFPQVQSALIAMDQRTGYVKALSGAWDFDESQYNRTRAVRQTGSVVKPIYYSRAYDLGIPPSTVLSGAPFRQGNWNPVGTSGTEDMTLYMGLTKSENRISIRAYRMVLDTDRLEGLNEWGSRLGLKDPFKGFPAEALGIEQRPADVLKSYAVFAAGGLDVNPVYIKSVVDDSGTVLMDNRSPRDPSVGLLEAIRLESSRPFDTTRRLINREAAFITAENLRNVAREGTGAAARKLGRPVFGKTGTLPFDVWFAGWTHELTAIAWLGQDTHTRFLGRTRARGNVFASTTALPMWIDFMSWAAGGRPEVDDLKPVPPGIVFVEIDPATGLLARDEGILMPHIEGTEPVDLTPLPVETLPWVQSAGF
ncbi:transglycosylase domain-containing protein [Myxococcota bacterium]|nr:transglycosylase domain-containing protein [Myxococcota bacterium]